MAFQLYEDQEEFVHNLRLALQNGNRAVLGVASPAFGKTVVAAHITEQVRNKNPDSSVWFVVHRKNLLRQTDKSFWSAKIEHGLITSGKRQSKLPIQIGTIGTVHSRMNNLSPPKVMFVDEAHLSRGRMFSTVIKWVLNSGGIVIGLTGTPCRLDGKPLGDLFECLIEAKSTGWLIEQGRLSDYSAYTSAVQPDLTNVKKTGGDYNTKELAGAMRNISIVGDTVAHWKKHANGMRTVAYCVNVEHSKSTCEAFNAAGIPSAHVDASTTEQELKQICEDLADRKVLVLFNCELVIEGFDLSAQVGRDVTLECCILLRPTQSVARYLQMVFRALRRKPQEAVILDHAGCIVKHGLPCALREWSLTGKETGKRKKKDDDEPDVNIQQCKKCYAVFPPTNKDKCPKCGAPIERQSINVQVADVQLEKIDKAAVEAERKNARKEQGMAKGLIDLVSLGVRRKLKKPAQWAAITHCARQGRKPTGEDFEEAKKILRGLHD